MRTAAHGGRRCASGPGPRLAGGPPHRPDRAELEDLLRRVKAGRATSASTGPGVTNEVPDRP